jgi:arsenite methyltransferase
MLGFDERHLLLRARAAGFTAITLDHHVSWDVPAPAPVDWEAQLHTAPNPLSPTYAEAMAAVLTPAERDEVLGLVRARLAAGAPATRTMATAYLTAVRP